MKRFCKECGKEAQPEHKVCIHCGTPLKPLSEDTEKVSQQTSDLEGGKGQNSTDQRTGRNEQNSKILRKKKGLFAAIGALVVLLVVFSVWAQNYQSPESVYKRFVRAATEQDSKALQDLVIHENGSSATKGEADALIKLVDEEGEYALDSLFSIEPHGKFLFIYQANKAVATDQYAYYADAVKGLTFSFNEYEPNLHKKEMYGPLIPGMYNVKASFKGDYGETTKEGQVTLANEYGDDSPMDIDINIANVTFYLDNYNLVDTVESYILIGDEKVKLSTDGTSKPVGPFILDGSQTVTTVAALPWGEAKSEPIDITDKEMHLSAELLSQEDFSDVSDVIVNFGEENAEAFAEKSTENLTNVSDEVKKSVKSRMEDDMYDDDTFYTGELVDVEIDRYSVEPLDDDKGQNFAINTRYTYKQGFHGMEEKPDFSDSQISLNLTMGYDEKDKSWVIKDAEKGYWGELESTDTVEGSGTVYGPSEESIKNAKESVINERMENFMIDYTEANVQAINAVDFYYLEDYIVEASPRWKEASEYIDYLDSKNITEDLLNSEVESVKETDDNTWEVTVLESFTIYNDDSSGKDKDFRTTVVIKEVDDALYVYELLETNEI